MSDNGDLRQQMQRIEGLLQEMEQVPDPKVRERARLIVQGLMDFHGAALEALLGGIVGSSSDGQAIIDGLARDPLVASLLVLYGLHPLGIDERVMQGLDKARPLLRSHGGNVELIGIVDGVVRLRLQGSCHGCPSSAATLKNAIEEAVYSLAPDVVEIRVEGEVDSADGSANGNGHAGPNGHSRIALPIMH